jgi:hypothetical protein
LVGYAGAVCGVLGAFGDATGGGLFAADQVGWV